MNGGLAAALDIHPRRRYTAHKRQSDRSAAAHIEFCSVLASLGVYTEFGIEPLIEGIDAQNLLADRGYDTSEIVAFALSAGINVVIPPKKNRKVQREYDRYLYKIRHLVENAFLWLKRWRGIATRYAKNTSSFLSAVHIRCIAIWLAVLA